VADVNAVEMKMIREYRSNDPATGYNVGHASRIWVRSAGQTSVTRATSYHCGLVTRPRVVSVPVSVACVRRCLQGPPLPILPGQGPWRPPANTHWRTWKACWFPRSGQPSEDGAERGASTRKVDDSDVGHEEEHTVEPDPHVTTIEGRQPADRGRDEPARGARRARWVSQ
jgi:hypothetical protein